MTSKTDFTKFFTEMPTAFPFDQKAFEDAFKSAADFNEKMTGISIDAAAKTTDIVTGSAQETFGNLRSLTRARKDASEYGQAFSDFAQAQMKVAQNATEALSELAQTAGTKMTETASSAGEEAAKKTTANANTAAKKAASAASAA